MLHIQLLLVDLSRTFCGDVIVVGLEDKCAVSLHSCPQNRPQRHPNKRMQDKQKEL
jgi:hypothetical protein